MIKGGEDLKELTNDFDFEDSKSSEYNNKIQLSCQLINERITLLGDHYIKEFMNFIKENKIEKLRTKEEYSIEFMLIGVLMQEYVDNARAFKNMPVAPIILLSKLRNKKNKNSGVSAWMTNRILFRSKFQGYEYSFKDFILIIKWLKATTGFKKEVLRLENWKQFFKNKNGIYVNHVIGRTIDTSLELNDIGIKYLDTYVGNTQKNKLNNVEMGYIELHRGKLQHFFNIVSDEIINQGKQRKLTMKMEKYTK